MNAENENKPSFMIKLASFIVDKRNLFFLIFSLAVIFSLVAKNWVSVENSLAAFLPDTSETSVGLERMEDNFVTYGTAKVMVANISYADAKELADRVSELDYVSMVQFDNSTDHYNDFSALFTVTFPYGEKDDRCLEALEKLKGELSEYDLFVSSMSFEIQTTSYFDSEAKRLAKRHRSFVDDLSDFRGPGRRNKFSFGDHFLCVRQRDHCTSAGAFRGLCRDLAKPL